jgi:type II secretory pathway component PulF
MFFSRQLPLASLTGLCRALRHNLGAGLTLRDVFRQQAERGPAAVRPVADRIRQVLDRGGSLASALEPERDVFPPLFLALASVGEETGHLPEIFGELETYYRMQESLRRQFRSRSTGPALQFLLAVLVIAGLFFILGAISASRGTPAPGLFGLHGAAAGWLVLFLAFGGIGLGYVLYRAGTRGLRHRAAVDAMLLRVPRLGPCLEALALGRFALALQLTLDTGMPVAQALRLSLAATGNAAYAARTDVVVGALAEGNDLALALSAAGIFPEDFRNMVAVGEEGGRVPEIMRHQARHYHEESERRLTALTRLATGGVYVAYIIFMVIAILKVAGLYLGALGGV